VYYGLEGFYLLTDDEEPKFKLPTNQYDVPLSLSAKQYSNNGTLIYDTHDNNGVLGDVIEVLDRRSILCHLAETSVATDSPGRIWQ
jgi:bilirubin oxidase